MHLYADYLSCTRPTNMKIIHNLLLAFLGTRHVHASPRFTALHSISQQLDTTTPTAPGYTFLYTANITISDGIDFGTSPFNHRTVYPITGGSFLGPRLNGNHSN